MSVLAPSMGKIKFADSAIIKVLRTGDPGHLHSSSVLKVGTAEISDEKGGNCFKFHPCSNYLNPC